jgi:hypothetical protein
MAFWDTPRHLQKQIPRCAIAHQPEPVLAYVLSALRAGKGVLKVAAECGVGSGTVHRIQHTVCYTELAHGRFKGFGRDCLPPRADSSSSGGV